MYRAIRVFFSIGLVLLLAGGVLAVRYLVFFLQGQGAGHVQSVIVSAVLIIVGFQTMLNGLLADLIASNRKMLEIISEKVKSNS